MGLVDAFRATIRAALGLPADPGEPPDLMRLGKYEARVDKCSPDGSIVDVTPLDARISPEKNVPVDVGIPGAQAVVSPGAIVDLGWKRGDPGRPYVVPSWGAGATVTKLVVKASMVFLGDESGAEELVKKSEFNSHIHSVPGVGTACATPTNPWTGTATSATPTTPATGTTKVKAV